MLIVRLMKRCNNNCSFCMVHEEMEETTDDISIEALKKRIAQQEPGSVIDFFGGEPTLYPDFVEALAFSNDHGYLSKIATNGRKFADRKYTNKITSLNVQHIRTSLYGATQEVHDFHTRCIGSFDETICGIENIIQNNIELLVNIVITSKNFKDLTNIVTLLSSLEVKSIKFSSLIKAMGCINLVPNNAIVREHINNALKKCVANNISIEIEKSPLCLAPEYYLNCIFEKEDNNFFTKISPCEECQAKKVCPGISVEQALLFKNQENLVLPFSKIESSLVNSNILSYDVI